MRTPLRIARLYRCVLIDLDYRLEVGENYGGSVSGLNIEDCRTRSKRLIPQQSQPPGALPSRHTLIITTTLLFMLGLILGLLPEACVAQTQQQPPSVQRPILFVHGWCGDSDGWKILRTGLANDLHKNYATFYPDTNNYDAYYDGISVAFVRTSAGTQFSESEVPSEARFFPLNSMTPRG
jgi:hypothetical protein